MISHQWSESFVRARGLLKADLDHRAINVCEAWIIWADPFNVAPDAALIAKLGTSDAPAVAVLVRQIAGKLARECPISMPMQVPAEFAELMEGGRSIDTDAGMPWDYTQGPRP